MFTQAAKVFPSSASKESSTGAVKASVGNLNRMYESSYVYILKSCAQSKVFVAILAYDDWYRSFSDSLRSVSLAPTLRFMKEKPTSALASQ